VRSAWIENGRRKETGITLAVGRRQESKGCHRFRHAELTALVILNVTGKLTGVVELAPGNGVPTIVSG
jgi:hypothetical protein